MGKSVKDALATKVGSADKPESLYSRRLLNHDLDAGYIGIEHAASDARPTSSRTMFACH